MSLLCQHCYFVGEAVAAPAGLTVRVSGGNGSCVQRFTNARPAPSRNDEEIGSAMIGCYDFAATTTGPLNGSAGRAGRAWWANWNVAIAHDSQIHAAALIASKGIEGMREYWGHTLDHEAAGYTVTSTDTVFRIDMHVCPSKGFLIRNGLAQYRDYCDHCIGWLGPVMKDAGFVVTHEHNHCGKCWWEIRRKDDLRLPARPARSAASTTCV